MRDPRQAYLVTTTGLIDLLSERELAAVIAHELAHVASRDTLVAGTLATIVFCLRLPLQGVFYLIRTVVDIARGYHSGREGDAPGTTRRELMLYLLPIVAPLLQLAVTRSREYRADATGRARWRWPAPSRRWSATTGHTRRSRPTRSSTTARQAPPSAGAGSWLTRRRSSVRLRLV